MDRRKKYFVVLDTETAGGLDNPLVYDFGFAICDKKGNIYEERSFVIEEIFSNKKLMTSAYYAKKLPQYYTDIETGKRKVVSMFEAREEFLNLLKQWNIETICAYNLKFDMNALKNTIQNLTHNRKAKFLTSEFKNANLLCLWSFACEVIYTQKTFPKVVEKNNWFTEHGNMRTSAEIGHRYLTGQYDFIENHTGLEDVNIEIQIMTKCFAQHKSHKSGIISHPWRIPNHKENWELEGA